MEATGDHVAVSKDVRNKGKRIISSSDEHVVDGDNFRIDNLGDTPCCSGSSVPRSSED